MVNSELEETDVSEYTTWEAIRWTHQREHGIRPWGCAKDEKSKKYTQPQVSLPPLCKFSRVAKISSQKENEANDTARLTSVMGGARRYRLQILACVHGATQMQEVKWAG